MTSTIHLTPNFDNLKQIKPDFTIIVGKNRYEVHLFCAILFSPRIRRLAACDPTIQEVAFRQPDTDGYFTMIIKLMYGRPITIDTKNYKFLFLAACFFENENLLQAVTRFIIPTLQGSCVLDVPANCSDVNQYGAHLEYITKNFSSIETVPRLSDFSIHFLDIILSSQDLDVSSESELFSWIHKLVCAKGNEYACLYGHINFLNLSSDEMNQFISKVPTSAVNGFLLNSICARLAAPIENEASLPQVQKEPIVEPEGQWFNYNHMDMFKGIIYALSQESNPFANGEIIIESGGDKQWALQNLFQHNDRTQYWDNSIGIKDDRSFDQDDQWLTLFFPNHKICLTGYSISHSLIHPFMEEAKHWCVFGSNDEGVNWEEIHEVKNADGFNKPFSEMFFDVPRTSKYFSSFKIQQLENFSRKPDSSKYRFILDGLEIFGHLVPL